jgi:uncharacterized protein (TIGR00251 family)
VSAVRAVDTGVVIAVWVTPGVQHTELGAVSEERVRIRLAARAVEGRANEALIKTLAGHLGVARSAVSLAAGAASRRKLVRVAGITVDEARERLGI